MPEVTEHANLQEALLAFQAELPHVGKDNEADTGKYKYKYADLTTLTDIALPLLNKHGLVWTTAPSVGEYGAVLQYSLQHRGAQFDNAIHGSYPLGPANQPPQALGSAITYARRYALCAVTGIAPGGDDDDAHLAQNPPQATAQPAPASLEAVPALVVNEWVEAFGNAPDIPALQSLWEDAGKSGVTRSTAIVAAKDKRKEELK